MHPPSPPRKLRILQIHHALYIPYLLTQGFRELGHKADNVYFDFGGKSADLTWGCDFSLSSRPWATPQAAYFFLRALRHYDVFHFWARPYLIPALHRFGRGKAPFDLALLKALGKKISYQSDGCWVMVRPSVWESEVDPEVCGTCRTTQPHIAKHCSDKRTVAYNTGIDRFCDVKFGTGTGLDFEKNAEFVFLPVDTTLWHPGLTIPSEHLYRRKSPESIVIYHGVGSHVVGNRGNAKGTWWLQEAVAQLQREGYPVELMHVENVPNKKVRFYQSQADIVVDQLLFGGGGQNSRECLALGKPVLTRIHPQQRPAQEHAALPFGPPPYVDTDRHTIKETLIRMIQDETLRRRIGTQSAEFARNVLSPRAAAQRYLDVFQHLVAPGSGTRSSQRTSHKRNLDVL